MASNEEENTTPPTLLGLIDDAVADEMDNAPSSLARRATIVAVVAALAFVGAFAYWVSRPTDIYALAPGSVRNTASAINVEDVDSFPPTGQIGFTTVTVSADITRWEKFFRRFEEGVEFRPRDEILQGNTPDEQRRINQESMTNSQNAATLVALRHLGYDVTAAGTGVIVHSLVEDLPASAVLGVDDVIVAVDAVDVDISQDLIDAIRALAPGQEVELTIERADGGAVEEVSVVLGENPNEAGVAMLGVSPDTRDFELVFPIDVQIDAGRVGGPSAGLAFTLGLLDVLTPGELTGGLKVATTGTIQPDATVGPVGGARQKAVAARESGVDLFIVPESEYEEALKGAGDMRIEVANTLDDALTVLGTLGGNALALGRPGETVS